MAVAWDDIDKLTGAHERFYDGREVEGNVRSPILTSWQRCRLLGLVPDQLEIPYQEDLDLHGRLIHAATPVLDKMETQLSGERVSVILCDDKARVLQRRGGDPELNRSLDAVCLAVGFAFAEQIAGTNGIGTTLADRRPSYVFGSEHFAACMHPFACAGAPIRDPLSGQVEGILDLTCRRSDADPAMMKVVRDAARDIERRLLEQTTQRERDLLRAFMRSQRAARLPGEPPSVGSEGALPSIDDVLGRADQALLRAKAAELISSPHRFMAQVELFNGQIATLTCRSVAGLSGEAGIAVEASLPYDAGRADEAGRVRRMSVTAPLAVAPSSETLIIPAPRKVAKPPEAAPEPTSAPVPAVPFVCGETAAPEPGTADGQDAAAATGGGEGWLLLVGELGVGQLALRARQRLELLYDASVRIGTTLDVTRTAEELADVVVPRFADFVSVDLVDAVLRGDEAALETGEFRRVALGAVLGSSHLTEVGESVRFLPSTPQGQCLATREAVLEPDLAQAPGWKAIDPARTEKILRFGIRSLIAVPMYARGATLGVVSFYRWQQRAFEEDDLRLAEEMVGRAALSIDNARRFTREHNMALALQRSLLPRGLPSQNAVEVAHRYLPAYGGVSGDWYDVIPLSGARVALAVGDVVGHGLHAAATMGRLRTALQNFAVLDLPADDLLTCLDELVDRLDADQCGGDGIVGATCLYAVYDPVSRRCTLARAGHPLPALVLPDGTVEFPDVPAGPPLGLGGLPFETVDLEIPEGSELVLYTDGLIEERSRDIDVGLSLLRRALTHPGRPPEETCQAVVEALLPGRPKDDVALLVARMHALDPDRVATWELSADPANVSTVRGAVTEQLERWGLDELCFTTELVVSELVTNAIRYAREPIEVRLLRDSALICEVSDGSSTSPRMRRAATTDEGGRGLFLVAQLASRWGTRYTASGKVIWTEQHLPASPIPDHTERTGDHAA
ncbi:SpoIIE family protein phosphatase [Nonomuraea sp. SYSU D8015]|uniref:SpoIIE family protein phosphatase n=1 Tax=Nonomuraea sp. SYSU D8015 TaxID=2593644 RepID=UPI0016605B8C|nr:SpoIIE family protein phosphatase [Nonomuraea sp. SYSU D8015]